MVPQKTRWRDALTKFEMMISSTLTALQSTVLKRQATLRGMCAIILIMMVIELFLQASRVIISSFFCCSEFTMCVASRGLPVCGRMRQIL
jgi:hypothetical protein